MPEKAIYPRKSFKLALEIAKNIDKLGGKSSLETLANDLERSVNQSFKEEVNASVRHGLLIKLKNGMFELSSLYTDIKLSYSKEEKKELLIKSFLKIELYNTILNRYNYEEIPHNILDKILMKEFAVTETMTKKVSSFLIEGAEFVGLIVDDKVTLPVEDIKEVLQDEESNKDAIKIVSEMEESIKNDISTQQDKNETKFTKLKTDDSILGKNVNLNINISLSVPETTNEEVYNKFFEAMKKHLLS